MLLHFTNLNLEFNLQFSTCSNSLSIFLMGCERVYLCNDYLTSCSLLWDEKFSIWWQLPLTRPKSPKLNSLSRRKSFGDALNTSHDEKGRVCPRSQRHSIGCQKECTVTTTSKNKAQFSKRNSLGNSSKVKDQSKQEEEKTETAPKFTQKRNVDISLHHELESFF